MMQGIQTAIWNVFSLVILGQMIRVGYLNR